MKKKLFVKTGLLLMVGVLLGIHYGCDKESDAQIAIVTTSNPFNITSNSVTSGGNIISDGGAAVTSRGVCWSTSHLPTISGSHTSDGIGDGTFISNITGLSSNTYYYVRSYATNSAGTGYGDEIMFATSGTVSDIDGNIYVTINIGTQVWMAENLKTTKLNDGTAIPLGTQDSEWLTFDVISPKYCWYDNNIANKATYGALYKWYTVGTGKLCPVGWHVPGDAEWIILANFLGGSQVAGGKLKEAGTGNWISPNKSATNESGFKALPGGFRNNDGRFDGMGRFCNFWSSTERDIGSNAFAWTLDTSTGDISTGYGWEPHGFSVRCIKD